MNLRLVGVDEQADGIYKERITDDTIFNEYGFELEVK